MVPVLRRLRQPVQNALEFGVHSAFERQPRQCFRSRRKQASDTRRSLPQQGVHDPASQFPEPRMRPEPVPEVREFDETSRCGAPALFFFGFHAARKVTERPARFAARCFRFLALCRSDERLEIAPQHRHGNAPGVATSQHPRDFARREGRPKMLDARFNLGLVDGRDAATAQVVDEVGRTSRAWIRPARYPACRKSSTSVLPRRVK